MLAGAADFFSQRPPDALIFELNDSTHNLGQHPTIQALTDLGYGFFSLPQRLTRMRAFRFHPQNIATTPKSHDFIAARIGEIYADVARRLGAV